MLQTYKTILSQKTQLTSDCVLYRFEITDGKELSFIPGQYMIMMVPCSTPYRVNSPVEQWIARRLYSIASGSQEKKWFELFVKIIPEGIAGKFLLNLKVQDTVEFQGPAGMFTMRESPRNKVFMVTGTGYAPIRSMLQSISNFKFQISNQFQNLNETQNIQNNNSITYATNSTNLTDLTSSTFSSLTPDVSNLQPTTYNLTPDYFLLWGLPHYKDVCLFEELKDYVLRMTNFHFKICLSRETALDMIPVEDQKHFMLGRITNGLDALITNYGLRITDTDSDYYLCSGREIIDSLKSFLYEKNAPKEQVFFEKF